MTSWDKLQCNGEQVVSYKHQCVDLVLCTSLFTKYLQLWGTGLTESSYQKTLRYIGDKISFATTFRVVARHVSENQMCKKWLWTFWVYFFSRSWCCRIPESAGCFRSGYLALAYHWIMPIGWRESERCCASLIES